MDRHFSTIFFWYVYIVRTILIRLHCTYDLYLCTVLVKQYRTYALYNLELHTVRLGSAKFYFHIRQIILGSRAILVSSCELSPEPVSELPGDKQNMRYSSQTIKTPVGTGMFLHDCFRNIKKLGLNSPSLQPTSLEWVIKDTFFIASKHKTRRRVCSETLRKTVSQFRHDLQAAERKILRFPPNVQ